MPSLLGFAAILLGLILFSLHGTARHYTDGFISEEPYQLLIQAATWDERGYKITPLADFMPRARVLEKRATDNPPAIPLSDVIASSANMHMIPANRDIRRILKSVRPGNLISLSGNLVAVESKEGWKMRSSLSRTDSGGGACEVVWVKSLSIL